MSDYLPKHTGGPFTITATADLTGGRLVKATGAPAGADAADVIGVAGHDAKSGSRVPVYDLNVGVHRLVASGAVLVGALVAADAGGKVKTAGATPGSRVVLGTALTAATADGDTILVKG